MTYARKLCNFVKPFSSKVILTFTFHDWITKFDHCKLGAVIGVEKFELMLMMIALL